MGDVIENAGAMAMQKLVPPKPIGKIEKDQLDKDEIQVVDDSAETQSESFLRLFFSMIKTNLINIPKFLKGNWIWLLSLAAVWCILSSIPTYKVPYSIRKVYMFLIFLTASYNNFIGKAILAGFIYGTGIPMFKEIKLNGIAPTIDRYKRTFGVIIQTFKKIGTKAYPIFTFGLGIGLFVSNYLSRNNKIDKYLVCFLCGFILFKALSQGFGSIQVRLVRTFFSDFFKLFKARSPVNKEFIYILFSGLSAGFIGSFISYLAYNKLGDNAGYIIGSVAVVLGIVLSLFIGEKNATKKA